MTTTPEMQSDIEQRLRAALSARAELVRPEDLAPLAPVVALRPRWQSPWVLLATAAVVLLVLGVVFQGLARDPRSDGSRRSRTSRGVELPPDVGRDWEPDDLSTARPPRPRRRREKEKVDFLGEPTKKFDGRIRLQTTLSSTGEEAYGIAELGTTIGTSRPRPDRRRRRRRPGAGALYDDADSVRRRQLPARLRPARRPARAGGA